MKTRIVTLKNKVKLIHTYIKEVSGVELVLSFNAGAINDPMGKAGVAHFSEHALASAFSTERYTRLERREIATKFNYHNASTSLRSMNFYGTSNRRNFEQLMDFCTDAFSGMKYLPEDFESEKPIIIDEILTRRKTNERVRYRALLKHVFKEKESKNTSEGIAGSVESFNKIKIEDLKTFISNYITQENLKIIITGHITLKDAIKLANKYVIGRVPVKNKKGFDFEDYKGYKKPNYVHVEAPEQQKSLISIIYQYSEAQKIKDLREDCVLALFSKCLSEKVLAFYRLEKEFCYSSTGYVSDDNKCNICEIIIQCNDDNAVKAINEYKNFLKYLKEHFTVELFEKQKQKMLDAVDFDLASIHHTTYKNIIDFEYYNKVITSKQIKKSVESITFDDLLKLYEEIFKVQPHVLVVSSNKEFDNFDYKKFIKEIK